MFVYLFVKLAIFILFLLSSTVTFFSTFWDMKKYFVKLKSRLLHSTTREVTWYFWVFRVNPFSLLWSIFFPLESFVSFGLLVSCLSLSQSALFEYHFLNITVNANFFSDLKFEYYCEHYPKILLQESLK